MNSIKDILYKATARLRDVTDSPQREACLLMAFVLKRPYEDVYFAKDHPIKDEQTILFHKLLERRLKHEPLSKIREHKEFWSLPFRVTADTLDPRPDSEILIEAVLNIYQDKAEAIRILDLGTGTGCLLLTLLHQYPNATGIGVDLNEAACLIAKENAYNLNLEERAGFVVGNWGDSLKGTFDIIMSNPPYIGNTEVLPKEVADYDPDLALYAGNEGLDAYRALACQVSNFASPHTKMFFEMGKGQFKNISRIFSNYNFIRKYKDLQGIERVVVFCMYGMSVD